MTEYTWISGRFMIKQPGKQWQRLADFPSLAAMDRSINNSRGIELAKVSGSFVGQSEGYALHQIWKDSDSYQLVPPPRG